MHNSEWYWTEPHDSHKDGWLHNGSAAVVHGTQFLIYGGVGLFGRSKAMVYPVKNRWRAVANHTAWSIGALYREDFDTAEEARAVVTAHVRLS